MERRWPWKKKSSDKAALERAATAAALESATGSLASIGSLANQDSYKKPNYVQLSVESYTQLTALENQVKTYEEQFQTLEKTYEDQFHTLENQIEELNEKLSQAWAEVETKDSLAKKQAKVAEDAVAGWEKAETEAIALQSRVDSLTFSKRAAEDRAAHLDGSLKEYMQQIRIMKEEHAQELRDVISSKTKQWEEIKYELESKIANFEQQLLMSTAENDALSRSLRERGYLIVQIKEEKSQAETEIEVLKSKIDSCEREVSSLKYELHIASKELEIRTEEKNMSVKSADVANKQYLEGVKKVTKLEAECQRLRSLVRKKLPGPAALAQMRSEVETLGRENGDSRTRRSSSKPSSPHSPLPDFIFDNAEKIQKDNDFLTNRLLAMEEEMKMLKEALAKRNSELQVSRNTCAKTASKLQRLESQLNQNKDHLKTKTASSTRSLTSVSDDGNDDSVSCAESWTPASVSGRSQSKKEKSPGSNKSATSKLELMDDFLEMEKLARTSSEATERVGTNGSESEQFCATPTNLEVVDPNQSPQAKLRSSIISVFESLSKETDLLKTVESIKSILQNAQVTMNHQTTDCDHPDAHSKECCSEDPVMPKRVENSVSWENVQDLQSISKDLALAISQIHDFVLSLGDEIRAVRVPSADINGLIEDIEKFSVTFSDTLDGNRSLVEFVLQLSRTLPSAYKLNFSILACNSNDGETNSSDCVDKIALPENKVTHSGIVQERYPHMPDSPYDPELPHIGTLGVKFINPCTSLEEFDELKLEKDRLAEDLEHTKCQLLETQQLLPELRSQLLSAENSNSLAETQLKCMAESYRSLEKHAKELETEVDLLQSRTKALEFEIQELKRNNQNTLDTCNCLQERLERNRDILESSEYETDYQKQQEKELAAAAEKLAKCQETISQLGKQFESLRPQEELFGSPRSVGSHMTDGFCQTEKDTVAGRLNSTGSEIIITDLSVDPSSPDAGNLTNSPVSSSKLPRHRHTMSGSSLSSSTPTPEKYTYGFGRIFASKRRT